MKRDERRCVRAILEIAVVLGRLAEDRGHLFVVGSVANDQETFARCAIDDEIVEHRASFVACTRIERLAVRDLREVIRDQIIDDLRGILPTHLELAHVRHIEHAACLSNRLMFVDDARVLYRHLEAGEWHHPGAGLHVSVVKGRLS